VLINRFPPPPQAALAGDAAATDDDRRYLALVKGEQHYLFVFHRQRAREVLTTLARYARNPDLDFTWQDATQLREKVLQEAKE
jgi:hypothetical protein